MPTPHALAATSPHRRRWQLLLPLLVLLAGLAVAWAGMRWLQAAQGREADVEFARLSQHAADALRIRMALNEQTLAGLAGMLAAAPEAGPAQRSAWLAAALEDGRLPHLQGFGKLGPDAPWLLGRHDGAAPQAIAAPPPTADGPVSGYMLLAPAGDAAWLLWHRPAQPEGAPAQTLFAQVNLPVLAQALIAEVPGLHNGLIVARAGVEGMASVRPLLTLARPSAEAAPQARSHTVAFFAAGEHMVLHTQSTDAFEAQFSPHGPQLLGAVGALASLLLATILVLLLRGRARAEALAESMTLELDRLAAVARHSSNSVMICDTAGRITWVNEGFTRMTGHTLAQARGHTAGALLGHDEADPAALQALNDARAAVKPCRTEILDRARDGRAFWVDTEFMPLHDAAGRHTGFMEVASDITEHRRLRQQLEAALAHSQALLRTLHMHAIVSEADPAGCITEVNDAFCTTSGYRREELIGRTHAIVNSGTHPPEFWRGMWQSIASGTPWRGQVCNRARDGRLYWVDTVIAPVQGDDGRITKYVSIRHDITDHVQAQAEIRASQAFLDKAGRIGGVGGWALGLHGGAAAWTAQTCRILGLPPDARASLRRLLRPFARAQRGTLIAAARGTLEGVDHFDLELPARTLQGEAIWLRITGEAEWNDGGAVQLVGGVQDISARRALERQLRERTALLDRVVENLPCGLSVFDGQLELAMANGEFGRLLDLPVELLDQPVVRYEDILRFNAARGEYGSGADGDALVNSLLDKALGFQPHRFERTRPDGTVLDISGMPLPGGGFVTTYVDITHRRRIEAELRRSEQLLRGAIDAIDEAFALYDPDDRLVFCNDKYRQIYRHSADLMRPGETFEAIVRAGMARGEYVAAIGREEAWLAERMAQHRAADSTLVQKLDNGRTLRIVERRTADGHTVGFRMDITELVNATEAAQAASLAKGQFVANMSHELRTPMNAVLGMLALLRRTPLSARQGDYAAKAEGAARSLLGLLNDILDHSKVEAGKMTLECQPFSLDQLLRDLAVVLGTAVAGKPVEVLYDIAPDVPRWLAGDALRLQQVLTNLAGNAIKFTERGEVVLAVSLAAREGGGQMRLRFEVRDTGIGIAPEAQARIFTAFTQAEASTTRRFGGTGLGVAISQRLVQLMGGELSLRSTPGEGSTFFFTALLDETPPPAREEPAPALPPDARVLVVDDHATALELMMQLCRSEGWLPDGASSGDEAVRLVQQAQADGRPYRAVFIDWQMPGRDGFDTCRGLRSLGHGPAAPLVVMVSAAARSQFEQREAADQALLDGYLVKPATGPMLAEALAAAGRVDAPAVPVAPVMRRLQGMRLLVAEDNPNNQQVARELLEAEGAVVRVVGNGREAVAAIAGTEEPFDVVLMDVQMPVMDGHAATAAIRQQLGLTELPIVAMTANVLPADREASLAAGMNDHVGKPFDIDALVKLLRKRAGWRGVGTPPPVRASHLPAALHAQAAAAGVDLKAALARFGGQLAMYRRMLGNFVAELPGWPAQLLSDAGGTPAQRLHGLKGLAATLGAERLAAQAAEGEAALHPGSSQDSIPLLAAMARACEDAVPALQALHEALAAHEPTAPAAPPRGAEAGQALLRRLDNLLAQADMAAIDCLGELREAATGSTLAAQLAGLDDALGRLDFDQAQKLCRQLLQAPGATG